MSTRTVILAGIIAIAGGCLWQMHAAETKTTKKAIAVKATNDGKQVVTETRTAGMPLGRHFRGDLTLEKAVEIALRQNPEILLQIQEIERTRGLIIEVRAAALPHITIGSNYSQTDRRLLEGGGGGRGITSNGVNVPSGSLQGRQLAPENSQPVENTNTAGLTAGGTSTTNGGTTGLSTVRALRRPTATPIDPNSAGDAAANTTSDLGQVLEELTRTLNDNADRTIQNKSWAVTIEARQVLYAGGQIRAAIKIAQFTQDSAYYQLRDTVDRIIAEVREQFYLVLLNRSLITVAEEAVRLAEEQLQDQRNRFEAGTVPRFNVLRAEVEVANVQPNLIRAKNDYLLSQIQLGKKLGLAPGANGRPEFNCIGSFDVPDRHMSLLDALALARARRPFLKVQRQNILIDTEQIKVEMAAYKPRLDANVGYEIRNRSNSPELSETVNGWFFGVTGTWDIFSGFETFGRVKQARARLEQSKINYDDSVRQVELEVQSAFANLEQARQTVESQQKNVEQAEEAVRLARERFAAGAGTQLEILDARVALTRARTTELQARSDFSRGIAELDRATAFHTKYQETFHDPLAKQEQGIIARIANFGLPKPPEDLVPTGKR